MDLKQENLIVLGIFIFLLGVLVYINISSAKKTGKISISNFIHPAKAKFEPKAEIQPDTKPKGFYCFDKDSILSQWARDPFEISGFNKSALKAEINRNYFDENDPLMLSLIVTSDKNKTAVINNMIIKEGDMLLGEKVISIQPDGVLLQREGNIRMIQLQKRLIDLQIEDQR
jgi:hypothetical protein